MDKGEQIFCMALALQDNMSDIEDCDDDDICEYKKYAKKTSKALKNK